MSIKTISMNIVSWLFGIVFFAIGIVNMFWGNDAVFGVFIFLLSFIYFPPVTTFMKAKTGIPIPVIVKIIIGLFIIWASLGVGELFNKTEMMLNDLF